MWFYFLIYGPLLFLCVLLAGGAVCFLLMGAGVRTIAETDSELATLKCFHCGRETLVGLKHCQHCGQELQS